MEGIKTITYTYGFGIACFVVAPLFILLGLRSGKPAFKYTFYNLSAVFIALFLFETYGFFFKKDTASTAKFTGSFFDNPAVAGRKKDLGYGPKEDTAFSAGAIRKNNDTLVYNVMYSLRNGIRATPFTNDESRKKAWFLGCSFTFGDGLHDTQTLPFYFDEYTNPVFHTVNYGFSGYGPHQALKIAEEKILKNNLAADSGIAVYSFVPEHFLRAAGNAVWDVYGPWYEVENDTLVYKGTFDDRRLFKPNYFTKRIKAIWNSSFLYRSVFTPGISQTDVIRVAHILKRMNRELSQNKVSLYVLIGLTEKPDDNTERLCAELRKDKIPCFFIDSIIPAIRSNREKYFIPGDGHPNDTYNREVAIFLANLAIAKSKAMHDPH